MRWSIPRIHAGREHTFVARSPAASTTAAAPSAIGGQSCLRSGDDDVRRVESASAVAVSVAVRAATSARSCSVLPVFSRYARACSAASEIGSGHSGVSTYGIELEAEDVLQVAHRRLAERVDERRVDVAVLQAHPRFVERPRAVHLDVRLDDRGPGAHGVERRSRTRTAGRRGSRTCPST